MTAVAGEPRTAAGRQPSFLPTSRSFTAIGCEHSIVASDPHTLDDAVAIAESYLHGLDRAASRFRGDSELSGLNARARHGDVTAVLSAQLTTTLAAALRVARLTGGLVDPTVGAALEAAGYDDDLSRVQTRATTRRAESAPAPGWERVLLDERARLLTMPAGTVLDVGASAKAMAADHVAWMLSATLPGGFVVNLGGDIAIGGSLPEGGWQVGVDDDGRTLQVITSHGQALATSSTRKRVWQTEAGPAHHIVDPRTGAVADAEWAQVTCCAATALEANAATTAALVMGATAPLWLHAHGLPALLMPADGSPALRVGGWPPATPAPDSKPVTTVDWRRFSSTGHQIGDQSPQNATTHRPGRPR